MNKVRIGNDISVSWRITDSAGQPLDLEGRVLTVFLQVGSKLIPVRSFEVDNNLITFTFHGADQKYTGCYNLKLIDGNDQSSSMTTYDVCNIFTLVGHSWQADNDVSEGISVVSLNSQVIGYIGPKGDRGEEGTAAGFGTVEATVDGTSGTPGVVVNTSGPNAAKNFSFAFSGLKGPKGDPGPSGGGSSDDPTGFLQRITYEDGTWTFDGNLVVTGNLSVEGGLSAANIETPGYMACGGSIPSESE